MRRRKLQKLLNETIAFPVKALDALKRGELPDINKDWNDALNAKPDESVWCVVKPKDVFGLMLGIGIQHPEKRREILAMLDNATSHWLELRTKALNPEKPI